MVEYSNVAVRKCVDEDHVSYVASVRSDGTGTEHTEKLINKKTQNGMEHFIL